MVAIGHRAGAQRRGIRSGARLGQAIACQQFHGAELRQPFLALRVIAIGVDHPRRHVVDRDIGGRGGAALRQLLVDQGGIERGERGAADVLLDVHAAEAEGRRLAQGIDRKDLLLVPIGRVRHHLFARKRARRLLKRPLLLAEIEVHRALAESA